LASHKTLPTKKNGERKPQLLQLKQVQRRLFRAVSWANALFAHQAVHGQDGQIPTPAPQPEHHGHGDRGIFTGGQCDENAIAAWLDRRAARYAARRSCHNRPFCTWRAKAIHGLSQLLQRPLQH